MSRDLYDCTAAELATHSVKHLNHDTAPGDAAAWLDENGYDAAPVYADNGPIGFIHTDDSRLTTTATLSTTISPRSLSTT